MSGRFKKGQSGNSAGRPKARRPHVSAFYIIFDKTLTVTQGGIERELTIDEALQLQTYQAAIKGSKMAVRAVLKMIEKREVALAKTAPPPANRSVNWAWGTTPGTPTQPCSCWASQLRIPTGRVSANTEFG